MAARNGRVHQVEIELINKELTATSSQPQRITLLRRLNGVQASTGILPPEILSLIFQHIYHSNNLLLHGRRQAPRVILNLGHVSSYWRQIVWSTPRLWSDLTIEASSDNIRIAPLLQLYLRNVGGLPFSFYLVFHWQSLPAGPDTLDSIASVLFHESNAAKIQSLSLTRAPWEWAMRFTEGNFSSLKYLDLDALEGQCQDSDVLDLAKVPSLHAMMLSALDVNTIELCWPKITKLDLSHMPIDPCVKVLTNCPNLVEFCCVDPFDPPDDISIISNHRIHGVITLDYLEILRWTHHYRGIEAFQHLRFPALRELTWSNQFDPALEEPVLEELAFRTLISNLPPTLSSLTFLESDWTIPFLKDIFRQAPEHLEHLSLDGCPRNAVGNVFSVLADDVDTEDHSMLLPSLEEVFIFGGDDAEVENDFSPLILRFLQNRFRRGCLKFCLEIERFWLGWPPGVRDELCQMQKEGFELEIYEGSEKVDWLEATEDLTP